MKFQFLIIAILIFYKASGQAGLLDSTFGADGRVYGTAVRAFDMKVNSDGTILVAGRTHTNSVSLGDFVVDKYLPSGAYDSTFGVGGTQIYTSYNADHLMAMELQADGKIVLGGIKNASLSSIDYNWAMCRMNSDGSPDPTMGMMTNSFSQFNDYLRNVHLQPDGKILACGQRERTTFPDAVVLRRNSDGSLDSTFGAYGQRIFEFSPNYLGGLTEDALDMVIQPDGKIVCSGYAQIQQIGMAAIVFRLNTDGSPDSSFNGNNFFQTIHFGVNDSHKGIRIIMPSTGGYLVGIQRTSAVCFGKLKSDASPDSSFGINGKIEFPFDSLASYRKIYDLIEQPDGKILFCGSVTRYAKEVPYIGRINIDGSPDSSFGSGGYNFYNANVSGNCDFQSIEMQTDGKILASGYFQDTIGSPTFYTVRLLNDVGPSNIQETEKKLPALFPNPGSGYVTIFSENTIISAIAISLSGQTIELNISSNTCDVNSLSPGFYAIRFTDSSGKTMVNKFVKLDQE